MKNVNELDLLKTLFEKNDIEPFSYSIGAYGEEAACIERIAAPSVQSFLEHSINWIVYDGEKGSKHNIRKYTEFLEAGKDLIVRVTETNDEEDALIHEFLSSLDKLGIKNAIEV